MDIILRLVIVVALLIGANTARADMVPATGQVWQTSGSTTFPSGSAACQSLVDTMNANSGTNWPFTGVIEQISGNNYKCQYLIPATGALGYVQTAQLITGGTCPANSTGPVAGQCTCNTGYIAEAGQCVQDNSDCEEHASNGDTYGGTGYVDLGSNPNSPNMAKCAGGCEVRFEGSITNRVLDGGTYKYFGTGTLGYTGFGCSTGDAPQPSSALPSSTCGSGQVLANINGESKCLAGGTDPVNPNTGETETGPTTETTTEKTTDGSGNTTTTQTTSTTNPDGSVTTKTTTTNCDASGDNCTSTTTEETEGGDPLKTFCEENPKAKICTDKEGSFGGSCASGFICEGDAIQCAIAREQHTRNCQLWAQSDEATLYDSIKSGTDSGTTNNPALLANRETISFAGAIDQSHEFTPQCMPDLTQTIMGQSITIPFSSLCPYLEIMGNLVIMAALMVAARIVGVF